jgi:hypothetical protein
MIPLALPLPAIEAGAIALYAAPMGVFLVLRSSRSTSLASLGLDVPLFVALDLLLIVLLACVVPLEVAVLLSRPGWLLGCAAWALRRRRLELEPPRLPVALTPRALATVLGSAAIATAISAAISRHYLLWDRAWHSAQVSTIGMQSIPLYNVYEPKTPWRYHYAADVLAAAFRTLSLDSMSSNRALSLAHDASFGLTALSLSLLLLGLGHRPGPVPALGGASVVLSGPIPLHGTRFIAPMFGFMYPNFLSNSFRPHVALAGLLMVGFVGSVADGALDRSARSRRRVVVRILAMAGLLSLTDEASLALLDLALVLAWLACPWVLLGGSFSPGGAVL